MRRVDRREVPVVDVATTQPSPFARSLLFGYVAQFVYEGDSPLAERRAAALALDQGLLAELLGRAELRELLDPEVLAEVEAELQRLAPDRRARDAEGVADLLRLLGPLTHRRGPAERSPTAPTSRDWLAALADARRVVEVRIAGEERWAAVEDVGRLRDGLGVPVPPGTPDVVRRAGRRPARRPGRAASPAPTARSPPTTSPPGSGSAAPWCGTPCSGWPPQGRVLDGEFRPVRLRQRVVRRRGAAPAAPPLAGPAAPGGRAGRAGPALGRFLAAWQHVGGAAAARRRRRARRSSSSSPGCPVPASALEPLVLPSRVRDYEPR